MFSRSEAQRVRICVRRLQSALPPLWERWARAPADRHPGLVRARARSQCPKVRGDVVLDLPAAAARRRAPHGRRSGSRACIDSSPESCLYNFASRSRRLDPQKGRETAYG